MSALIRLGFHYWICFSMLTTRKDARMLKRGFIYLCALNKMLKGPHNLWDVDSCVEHLGF